MRIRRSIFPIFFLRNAELTAVGIVQVNAGKFFADQLGEKIKAEKTLVQKSGYFARSAAPNDEVNCAIAASLRDFYSYRFRESYYRKIEGLNS